MVSRDRWSLVTGSFTLKCVTFCQKLVVLQGRWSLMTVVSQDRFHCTRSTATLQHVQSAQQILISKVITGLKLIFET